MRYRSSDGLMSSSDPEAVALWEKITADHELRQADWNTRLRAMGVKLAHPDDGWVDRERQTFSMSWYPRFDDRPEVGDLMAFGTPPRSTRWDRGEPCYQPTRVWDDRKSTFTREIKEPESACSGYRIVRVTKVDRHHSIIGYHQDFEYEDTGLRLPPPPPARARWWRWADVLDALLGRRCRLDCGQRVFPKDVATHEALNHAGDLECR